MKAIRGATTIRQDTPEEIRAAVKELLCALSEKNGLPEQEMICILFSNTADNLDAVSAGRLFDRFYTVESGRNSTGLGLSIARLLTERMGGTISASLEGRRLSITVQFPGTGHSGWKSL